MRFRFSRFAVYAALASTLLEVGGVDPARLLFNHYFGAPVATAVAPARPDTLALPGAAPVELALSLNPDDAFEASFGARD